MLRYAITDRRLFPGTEKDRRNALVAQAARLAEHSTAYLQVREKDLPPDELQELSAAIVDAVTTAGGRTRVLLNGPPAIALAAGVGLHLPFTTWSAPTGGEPLRMGSISCHSADEIGSAARFAEVLLFAPVFEKQVAGEHVRNGSGLAALTEACARAGNVPVYALGGVTRENETACLAAGAAGVAGIRMFL